MTCSARPLIIATTTHISFNFVYTGIAFYGTYLNRLLWHILHLDGVIIIYKSLSGDNDASLLGDYETAMLFLWGYDGLIMRETTP